jgi:hypothetical protein
VPTSENYYFHVLFVNKGKKRKGRSPDDQEPRPATFSLDKLQYQYDQYHYDHYGYDQAHPTAHPSPPFVSAQLHLR